MWARSPMAPICGTSRSSPSWTRPACICSAIPLLAVRIGVTLVVATASFYLVEEPIRRGRMRSLTEWKAWLMTSAACLGVVAVTVAATLPSDRRGRRHHPGGRGPVQRATGEGGHLRGLVGLPGRVRHVGQPAPEQLRRQHLERCHHRLWGAAQHGVHGPRRRRSDGLAVQPLDPEIGPMAGAVDRGPEAVPAQRGGPAGRSVGAGGPVARRAVAAHRRSGVRRRSEVVARAGRRRGHLDRGPPGDDDRALLQFGRTGQRPALARGLSHPAGRLQRHGPPGGRRAPGHGAGG